MLEFLAFALFSAKAQLLFSGADLAQTAPAIEILAPAAIPELQSQKIAPVLLNDPHVAILATDLDSGKILLSENPDRAQSIASLTKIMTVLVIMDHHHFDEVVTVPYAATQADGAKVDLLEGEKITVKTLLEAALIPSGNDAAMALAIYDAGTEPEFVKKMNQKAQELNLRSAHFYNSTGLDIWDPKKKELFGNQMSARDIVKMTRIALQNDFFRKTVAKHSFAGTSTDGEISHAKGSTNQLFGSFVNVKGVKTGYERSAGQCFVALGESTDGHDVLTVILGSSDRFGETKKLLSWIYDSFDWK